MKVRLLILAGALAATLAADEPRLVIDTGGHASLIRDVIFTRDGKQLISAGDDKVVRVWDTTTGETVRVIRGEIGDGYEGKIFAAALSADERYLAVGGWLAGTRQERWAIRLHDFASGEVLALLEGHTNTIQDLAFSPEGRFLVSGSADDTVRIWDVTQRALIQTLKGHTDAVYAVAFSPDGERVVSGSDDDTLRLWNAETGELIREMKGHEDDVHTVAFSPDGRYIASGSWDKTVRLWDGETGTFVRKLGEVNRGVDGLAFSPDGRRLITGSSFTGFGGYASHVFSVPAGDVLARFSEHNSVILATAVSPDGRIAATGGGDDNVIYLWDMESGDKTRELNGKGHSVWSVAFAQDGASIAFGHEWARPTRSDFGPLQRIFRLRQGDAWQVFLGGQVEEESSYRRAVDQHGDLSLKTREIAGYDKYLEIRRGSEVLHEIERDPTSGHRHTCFTFTPDGRYIASGAGNGFLTLYSAETGKKVADLVGHTSEVWAVSTSPDGKTLVSGSMDQTVRLWDIPSGRGLLSIFVGSDEEWVAWTPQGYYASSPNGDRYIGWHVNRGVNKQADYYEAGQYAKVYHRPDVVHEFLEVRDIEEALKRANAKRAIPRVSPEPVFSPEQITQNVPPELFFASPFSQEETVSEVSFPVKGEARSASLPITVVTVLLNGLPVYEPNPNVLRHPFQFEVDLEPGRNVLTAFAEHDLARSKFERRMIILGSDGARASAPKHDLYLLAIGVSDYADESVTDLDYAARDALQIEKLFRAQEGGAWDKVHVQPLTDEKATRSAILSGLRWLETEGDKDDLRVLFLAGHGMSDRYGSYHFLGHGHDGDFDQHGVSWQVITRRLDSAPGKAILLADTCYAGKLTQGKTRAPVTYETIIKDMQTQYSGIATFASSATYESSEELPEKKHGAFTYALIEGLCGAADSGEKDRLIDTGEIGTWLSGRVADLTDRRQRPVQGRSQGLPDFSFFQVRPDHEVCASLQ